MKMKWLLTLLLSSLVLAAWATDRKITVTFTPTMPLTPTNVELICSSMYSHLDSTAIQKLNIQEDKPFTCAMSSDSKKITMIFHVLQE